MKKYLLLFCTSLFCSYSFSQTVQASLGAGSAPNRVRIYLKPTVTANAVFSTLQFNVALPLAITPRPSLTVVSSAFAGVNWIVSASYLESGYINYNILTGSSGYSLAVTANTEFQAMEVQFGPPAGCSTPATCGNGNYGSTTLLLCIADGGTGGTGAGNALFYCTGTLNSSGSSLYYPRSGVTVNNTTSYGPISLGSPRNPLNTNSSATYTSAAPLPIKFTDFNAVRRNNDGLLTWMVTNQDPGTRNFVVERSFNGSDFISVGSVDANFSAGSVGTYSLTDANITSLRNAGIVYYRIKEIDRDGHYLYSEVRSIKLDNKAITINLYPNPAQAYTNLMLDLQEAQPVAVTVTDVAGQTMQQFNFQGVKGNNQHKINLNKFAAGTYMIKVIAGDQLQTIPVVKTN